MKYPEKITKDILELFEPENRKNQWLSLNKNHCYIRRIIESLNHHLNDFLLIIALLKITVTLLKKVAIFGNFMVPKTFTTSLILVGTVSPKKRKQKFLQIVCSTIVSIYGVLV